MSDFTVRPADVGGMSRLVQRAGQDAAAALRSVTAHADDTGGSIVSWWYMAMTQLQSRAETDTTKAANLLAGEAAELSATATYYSAVDDASRATFSRLDHARGQEGALPQYQVAPRGIAYPPSQVTRPETAGDFKDAVDATPARATTPAAGDVDITIFLQLKTIQNDILNKASFSAFARDVISRISMATVGFDLIPELNQLLQGDWEGLGLHARGLSAAATTFTGIHANLVRGAYALTKTWTGHAADAFSVWHDLMRLAASGHAGFLTAVSDATLHFAQFAYHDYDAVNTAIDAIVDLVAAIMSYGATDVVGAVWRVLTEGDRIEGVTATLWALFAAVAKNISHAAIALNGLRALVGKVLVGYHLVAGSIDVATADLAYPIAWPDAPYNHPLA